MLKFPKPQKAEKKPYEWGRGSALKTNKPLKAKSPMKKRPRKPRAWHSKEMRDACNTKVCMFRLPTICRGLDSDPTVVPAHNNEGKGYGLKTPDEQTIPACFWCHHEYDQGTKLPKELKQKMFYEALELWRQKRPSVIAAMNEKKAT